MKLSERLYANGTIVAYERDDIAALEADLADANARAMELTARCDRLRAERDAAVSSLKVVAASLGCDTGEPNTIAMVGAASEMSRELADIRVLCREAGCDDPGFDAEKRMVIDVAARTLCMVEELRQRGAWNAEQIGVHDDAWRVHCDEAVAVISLVYEMREHALRRIHDRERSIAGKQSARLSNTLAAQSRWHRRAQAAEGRAIRAARQLATQVTTLQARLDGAIREMDAKRVEEHVRRVRESNPNVRIPESALEATSGGGGAAAADCICADARDPYATWVKCPLHSAREPRTIDGPSMRIGETPGPAVPFTLRRRADAPMLGEEAAAIRTALGCQPGHELDAIAALVSAKDAYRAERDEAASVATERIRQCMKFRRERDEIAVRADCHVSHINGLNSAVPKLCAERDEAIAERDARIAELTRDLLCANRDRTLAAERERDEAIARAELAENRLAVAATLRERMETELAGVRKDAARATRLGEDLKIALRMPHTGSYIEWAKEVRAAYDRAEAADAKLAKMRDLILHRCERGATSWEALREVLAII